MTNSGGPAAGDGGWGETDTAGGRRPGSSLWARWATVTAVRTTTCPNSRPAGVRSGSPTTLRSSPKRPPRCGVSCANGSGRHARQTAPPRVAAPSFRRRTVAGQATEPASLRLPLLIMSAALLAAVVSLFAVAWPGDRRQPETDRTGEHHDHRRPHGSRTRPARREGRHGRAACAPAGGDHAHRRLRLCRPGRGGGDAGAGRRHRDHADPGRPRHAGVHTGNPAGGTPTARSRRRAARLPRPGVRAGRGAADPGRRVRGDRADPRPRRARCPISPRTWPCCPPAERLSPRSRGSPAAT